MSSSSGEAYVCNCWRRATPHIGAGTSRASGVLALFGVAGAIGVPAWGLRGTVHTAEREEGSHLRVRVRSAGGRCVPHASASRDVYRTAGHECGYGRLSGARLASLGMPAPT